MFRPSLERNIENFIYLYIIYNIYMLISELISELSKMKKIVGDVEVSKNRAGTSIDHVYMYGVRCILESEYEYIGDDLARFDIDYHQKDKLAQFIVDNNLLKLLYDYRRYGKISLKLKEKYRHQIHSANDNFYFLFVDIQITNKEDFLLFSEELEKQHFKDVKVSIKYEV